MYLKKLAAILLIMVLAACAGQNAGSETKTISAEQLAKLIAQSTNYILVDVRTMEEYLGGHIPTALNIPYDVIGQTPPTKDKEALIIVYCRSGRRSKIAASTLSALGYVHVFDFGGIANWQAELNKGNIP